MHTKNLIRAGIVTATLASVTAQAGQEPAFYGRVELGKASIDESLDADGVPFSLNDSATAWHAALGYAFNSYFAIEGGYNDFGSVNVASPAFTVGAEADGLELGFAFSWPVSDRLSLTARAGFLWWDAVTKVGPANASDAGSDRYAGLGLEVQAGERSAITLGWTRYRLDDIDLDYAAVGLRWQFGADD